SAVNIENLKISGYGAVLRMHKRDYQNKAIYEPAEWRMAISLRGCKNVTIEGIRCESSGGDGIYIGSTDKRNRCEDVVIRNVVCHDNHRQGISVISAKNLVIENCVMTGTWGTPPQAGIDFEPNHPDEILERIIMRNCFISSNRGAGILMYLKNLKGTSFPVDIKIEKCYLKGGKDFGIAIGEVPDDGVRGNIVIEDSIVEDSEKGGVFIFNKSGKGVELRFINCVIINSPIVKKGSPIKIYQFRTKNLETLGGVYFENLFISSNQEVKPFEFRGVKGKVGIENISGNIVLGGALISGYIAEGIDSLKNLDLNFTRALYRN
ncbi:MAG: right-handed parallel beta-helix repeat-containing protein, partial [Candidatus Hydrogenedentes bacterium]|nr:right-handed parallel beta-helix repeat-containing protein [Candidatus Hydrogenedentota bacterium]